MPRERSLRDVARLGFAALGETGARLAEAEELAGRQLESVLPSFARVADPDEALLALIDLLRRHRDRMDAVLADDEALTRLLLVVGASSGLADFLQRRPDELASVLEPVRTLPGRAEMKAELLESVGAVDGFSSLREEAGWTALRVRYRRLLTRIVVHDLSQADPVAAIDRVTRALADLAGAALEASLAVARTELVEGTGPGRFGRDEVAATRFAVIGMGKAGASELNYLSDVDVIFVAEGDPEKELTNARAIDVATRLAVLLMRGTSALAMEPELWEVDPNLRPEGKQGALVRTLESHITYYDRWAKSWEFQALLKARPLAGDQELGRAYVDAVAPKVWSSASRENFVESVQRMRERVTENIPQNDVHYQIKLGPGGLRDIEFTVQLLQLVHGQTDDEIRMPGTLLALGALADRGYIGRSAAEEFAQAAGPELDLVVDVVLRDVLGDPLPHTLHRLDEVLAGGARPDLGRDRVDVRPPQLLVAGERARLEQRLELPALRPPVVVGDVRLEGAHERGLLAGRAQVRVDLPEFRLHRQRRGPAHEEHGEPGGDVDRTGVRQLLLRVALGDEDHVDVAEVVELGRSRLTHADDGEAGGGDLVPAEAARARALDQLGPRHGEGRLQRGSGEVGQRRRRPVDRRDGVGLAQVVDDDPGEEAAVPHAQRRPARLLPERREAVDGADRLEQLGLHLGAPGERAHRLEHAGQLVGPALEEVGEAGGGPHHQKQPGQGLVVGEDRVHPVAVPPQQVDQSEQRLVRVRHPGEGGQHRLELPPGQLLRLGQPCPGLAERGEAEACDIAEGAFAGHGRGVRASRGCCAARTA
ncbi:hypothetical protein C5C33_12520 [Rathayibacter sp. AY1H3]|nr:hypothetical protein C5C33_12520 [Rathayibacter sp. AY1H3]